MIIIIDNKKCLQNIAVSVNKSISISDSDQEPTVKKSKGTFYSEKCKRNVVRNSQFHGSKYATFNGQEIAARALL